MSYEPSSVLLVLEELTSKTSLQLDLALAAVSINDGILAKYVLDMEHEIDNIINQLFIHTMLSARRPKEASDNLLFIHVGNLVNFISDISANIAELVLEDINPFKDRNNLFLYMHEFVDIAQVHEKSLLIGKKEEDLQIQQDLGIDIMAIKRDNEIILGYQHEIKENDYLYLRGPSASIAIFSEVVRGHINDFKMAEKMLKQSVILQNPNELRPYEQTLLKIINLTTLMIDLGFLVQMNPPLGIRSTLREYEVQIDDLLKEFQKKIFRSFHEGIITENEALGLNKFSTEFEMISDAIITVGIGLRKEKSYMQSVIKEAMATAEDDINLIVVKQNSPYLGRTVREVEVETDFSGEVFDIELIKRKNKIIPYPPENTKIELGDMLVIKSYHNSEGLEDEEEEEENEQIVNQKMVESVTNKPIK